ncbi:unnamed protein product, partial (mitochondrion) [Musa textilis]
LVSCPIAPEVCCGVGGRVLVISGSGEIPFFRVQSLRALVNSWFWVKVFRILIRTRKRFFKILYGSRPCFKRIIPISSLTPIPHTLTYASNRVSNQSFFSDTETPFKELAGESKTIRKKEDVSESNFLRICQHKQTSGDASRNVLLERTIKGLTACPISS